MKSSYIYINFVTVFFLNSSKIKVIVRFRGQFYFLEKLTNNNRHEKICVEEVPEDLPYSLFSPFKRNLFSKLPHKLFVVILRDIIGLEKSLFFSQSYSKIT